MSPILRMKMLSLRRVTNIRTTSLFCSFMMILCTSTSGTNNTSNPKWYEEKYYHKLKSIEDREVRSISVHNLLEFTGILDPIMVPRVPGTSEHQKVKQYLIDFMSNLGWHIETDAFEDKTPYGIKPFENIIATLDSEAPRRLVLACHYDSKYFKEEFIGAIDSAVPCAMMLHLAKTMQNQLNDHKKQKNRVTLQFIFFDGEEAFYQWTDTDSIYGARHLAKKWENTPYPANNREGTTMLNRMDVLVLLDLLGTAGSRIPNFFRETSHLHNALVEAEKTLKRKRIWLGSSRPNIFHTRFVLGGVQDDHIPFLERNVDILHLIPVPFPSVWHSPSDNRDALDFPTIENLNRIFRIFVARYLHSTDSPVPILPEESSNASEKILSQLFYVGLFSSLPYLNTFLHEIFFDSSNYDED